MFDDPNSAVGQLMDVTHRRSRVNRGACLALCVAEAKRVADIPPNQPAALDTTARIARDYTLGALGEAESRFAADDARGGGSTDEHRASIEIDHHASGGGRTPSQSCNGITAHAKCYPCSRTLVLHIVPGWSSAEWGLPSAAGASAQSEHDLGDVIVGDLAARLALHAETALLEDADRADVVRGHMRMDGTLGDES
jgi:hypothetical protein